MKYMVVECHPGYAVVLDEDGNFSKVANMQYEVGQLVREVVHMQVPPRQKAKKWWYSLAAMAACLTLVLGLALSGLQQPYASVYVKINPEVRIDVDKRDMVVGLVGVNQDGIDLIEGYDFIKKNLDVVTNELVDRAIDMGYLQAEGQITISLDSQDQVWVEHHSQTLSHHVQTHLQERLAITVQVQPHHSEDHDGGGEHNVHGDTKASSTHTVTEPHRDDTHDHEERKDGHDGSKHHDGHG